MTTTIGNVMAVRLHNEDGDLVHIELDKYWFEDESENVANVYVQRFKTDGGTELGRIDRKERVYHLRHHGLQDFVRWSDRTVTIGIEELILANQEGCTELQYLDERNKTRYSITLDILRSSGYVVKREKIGWRWAVPLEYWSKRRTA